MNNRKLMNAFVSITCFVLNADPLRITSRCNTDFQFNRLSNRSKTIYETSWKRDCSDDVRDICTKNVTIAYFEMEPFTTKQIFTKARWPDKGILQQIVSVALAECCGSCISLNFNRVNSREALIDVKTKQENNILFPVFTQGTPHQVNATLPPLTTPIIHIPGAMFITKSVISAQLFAKDVVRAIVDIWPLFGVSLLLAFAAGVFCWILDTWWNKEEFPRTFLAGSLEGFWWAFISMTTVGYGDRAPKSIPARLFAVFWILCGVTIVALMTAALTTAISTTAMRQQASIDSGKIGILNDHVFEKNILIRGNSKKVYKNTIVELINSFSTNEIDAMLVDSFTAKTNLKSNELEDKNLLLNSVIQDFDQSYLGVTIYNTDLHLLIQEYLDFQRDGINDYISDLIHSLQDIQNDKIVANIIFTSDSGLFWPTIYVCVVILGIALLIGGAYESYQYIKRKKGPKKVTQQLTMKTLKHEEERFQDELEEMIKRWERHLSGIMNGYTIRGIFNKTNRTYSNIIIKLTPNNLNNQIIPEQEIAANDTVRKKSNKKALKTTYKTFKNADNSENEWEDDEINNSRSEAKTGEKLKVKKKTKTKKPKRSQTAPESGNSERKTKKQKNNQIELKSSKQDIKAKIVRKKKHNLSETET